MSDTDEPFDHLIEQAERLGQYGWWFGQDDLVLSSVIAQAEWKEHPSMLLRAEEVSLSIGETSTAR
jgi:hypothetical protein